MTLPINDLSYLNLAIIVLTFFHVDKIKSNLPETHHQAHPQPPTTVLFLFSPPQHPPEMIKASLGPEVWMFPMTFRENQIKLM